jgi:predicted metal-dependent hydrolase
MPRGLKECAVTDAVLPGHPPVPLVLRVSSRARRLSLRVSRLDGRVTLTAPPGVPRAEVMRFAEERADWVRGHLAEIRLPEAVGIGTWLPVEGRPREIVAERVRAARLEPGRLVIPARAAAPGAAVDSVLKARARDRLAEASDRHAAALGRQVARITLRDTRSRWGSCTADGALMYSWRLILAPPSVLDYVAAHEAAHLVEMNHSARFWALVERLCPDWQAERAWLRREGAALQAWRFRD